MSLLEARGLSVGYWARGSRGPEGGRSVVSGLDLDLEAGAFVALLGPNGSGKSTLLRTLVGLQSPLAGEVKLGGSRLASLDVAARARLVATVFTERFDAGWFTVADIVAFGRYPHTDFRNELGGADRQAIAESLEAVGLSGFAGRLFTELSDGERQKTMIARALAQESPLLVLDEPTAFLDAPARIEIFHLARRLARAGKGVVLSTHEVDLALREADQLWLVGRHGSLAVGSPETLALSGAVGEAFGSPGLYFDTSTGQFRAEEDKLPFALGISGEDPVGLAWTIRLAERLGLSLEPEKGRYDALVRVLSKVEAQTEVRPASPDSGPALGHAWVLETGSSKSRISSISALEVALRREIAAARAENAAQPPNL